MTEGDEPAVPAVPAVPSLPVGAVLARLDRGDPVLLLDVRNDEEFGAWKLEARRPVETLHIPYFDFIEDEAASVARVPKGRDVVVLCAKGGSSEMVAGMLLDAGIKGANVDGGMVAYGLHLEPVEVRTARAAGGDGDGGDRNGHETGRYELWQVNRRGRGCLSYVIVSAGEAVVVDPCRDGAWYERFAEGRGARIVRVLDTHLHADHVSGGPSLAATTGAPYFVAAGGGFELKHPVTPLGDGEPLHLGGGRDGVDILVRILSTPGHTPGSTSFLVDGTYLLSGDTLFVGSVGRPDLGGHVVEWGHQLFATLHERLGDLPGETVVLPAHYGGPAEIDGDGVVRGRLGELRRSVPEMRIATADAFVAAVREAVKDPPASYAEIIKVNLGGKVPGEETLTEWELGSNRCAASEAGARIESRR